MKRLFCVFMSIVLLLCTGARSFAADEDLGAMKDDGVSAMSADKFKARSIVLMEATTGEVLLANNESGAYSPASVTKIMTLLLVAESIDEGSVLPTDTVTVSSYAASMGGSQVFLEEGETFSVEELVKCTVIASANDAAVALAEFVAGSESEFVEKMNRRASELGLRNTNFENVTGLDDDTVNHVTSAFDIAVMSKELIKHDIIMKYSSLWQDSIRDGAFTLTNTNRLVRYYNGCNGLKTGSTDKAGSCISVTAKRGNMTLIAVVMGADSSNARNEIAKEMLDFGFANYSLFKCDEENLGRIPVKFGIKDSVEIYSDGFSHILKKNDINSVERIVSVPESVSAPISDDTSIGKIEYILSGKKLGESKIYVSENIEKITFWKLYIRIASAILK